jgi:hypothetical protein
MTEPDILANEMVRDASRDSVIDQECKGGPTFLEEDPRKESPVGAHNKGTTVQFSRAHLRDTP